MNLPMTTDALWREQKREQIFNFWRNVHRKATTEMQSFKPIRVVRYAYGKQAQENCVLTLGLS